ncbi:MAG TPA: hypothetical protein VNG32_05560 [Candidatus Dormibacteraeota bacterium]|nr:hypothetical protein [Candidatus Dormibacteraeota bacterium]
MEYGVSRIEKDIEGFFSRPHLITAAWTALFGIITFVSGILWNIYTSPTKVVVTNLPKTVNAAPVRVISSLPDNFINALNKLSKDLEDYQQELKHFERQALNSTTIRNNQSNNLEKSVADLTTTLDKITKSAAIGQQSTLDNDNHRDTKIQQPEFTLPNEVKGYTQMSMYGVTDIYCPQRDVQTITTLNFGFTVKNDDLLQVITPLFVSINKVVDATHMTQVYAQQYRIDLDNNKYNIPIKLTHGDYQFNFGFYKRHELEKEFPNFYEKECQINVVSN